MNDAANNEQPKDWTGPLPKDWSGGTAKRKFWRGKWVNLFSVTRKCTQCGSNMELDVTAAALEGRAKNAGLHLKRCATCRGQAVRTNSRPHVEGEVRPSKAGGKLPPLERAEMQQLRMANDTMKAELEGLYATVRELRDRLAKYEPPPGFEAMTANQAPPAKMPWE